MASDGFINLHRRIREHPYWGDPERFRAWVDVLFMAAWKPHRRLIGTHQVNLDRGELIASEPFLAARWGWSRGRVRRFLKSAEDANEIRPLDRTGDGTRYVVVKYDDYQYDRPISGTGDGTGNGHPSVQGADIREEGKKKGRKQGSGKSRATALPDDWQPTDGHADIAKAEGVDVDREADNFRDHAAANDRRQVDWDRAFNTWLRKAKDFGGGRANGNGTTPAHNGRYIPGLDDVA